MATPTLAELKKQIEALERINELAQQRIDLAKDASAFLGEFEKSLDTQISIATKQLNIYEQQVNDTAEALAAATSPAEIARLRVELQKFTDQSDEAAKSLDDLKKSGEAFDTLGKGIASTVGSLLGLEKKSDTLVGKFAALAKQSKGVSAGIKSIGKELKEYINLQSISSSILEKVQESTFAYVQQYEEAQTALAATTGAQEKYDKSLRQTGRELLRYNIGVEERGEAFQSLFTNMLNATEESDEVRKSLTKTSAMMVKLGVSVDTTSALFDSLIKGIDLTAEEANDLTQDMVGLGQDLQMPPRMLVEAFEESLDVLAVYGRKAPQIFKKVAAASKATGIQMNRLLDVTTRFDEFESAAEAAGTLNAVLGGNLVNTNELLMSSEEERIEILNRVGQVARRQYEMAGERGKFLAISLSQGLGLSRKEVMKFLNTSATSFDDYQKTAEQSQTTQEDFNQAISSSTTAMEKGKGMARAMALGIEDVAQGMNDAADAAWKMNDGLEKSLGLSEALGISGVGLGTVAAGTGIAGNLLSVAASLSVLGRDGPKGVSTISKIATATKGLGGFLLPLAAPLATLAALAAGGTVIGMGLGNLMNQFEFFGEAKDFSLGGVMGALSNFGSAIGEAGNFVFGNDVILRPGEKPIMLNKDDIVLAGTNLLGDSVSRRQSTAMQQTQNPGGTQAPIQITVVSQIDGREVARTTTPYIIKNIDQSFGASSPTSI